MGHDGQEPTGRNPARERSSKDFSSVGARGGPDPCANCVAETQMLKAEVARLRRENQLLRMQMISVWGDG